MAAPGAFLAWETKGGSTSRDAICLAVCREEDLQDTDDDADPVPAKVVKAPSQKHRTLDDSDDEPSGEAAQHSQPEEAIPVTGGSSPPSYRSLFRHLRPQALDE